MTDALKELKPVRVSSVPEDGFACPQSISDLRELALTGGHIVYQVMQHAGFDDSDIWAILSRAQQETSSAHSFICHVMFVGEYAAVAA